MTHNPNEWHHDASGGAYAKKQTVRDQRPVGDTGSGRAEGFFSFVTTTMYVVACGAMVVFALASLGYIEVPAGLQGSPSKPVPAVSHCDK